MPRSRVSGTRGSTHAGQAGCEECEDVKRDRKSRERGVNHTDPGAALEGLSKAGIYILNGSSGFLQKEKEKKGREVKTRSKWELRSCPTRLCLFTICFCRREGKIITRVNGSQRRVTKSSFGRKLILLLVLMPEPDRFIWVFLSQN